MKNNSKEAKRPTHILWQVNGEGEKARWTRIGAAWPNKDGKGLNLVFEALPLTGRTVIRELADRATQQDGDQQ
jgi:hypothetical protein